MNRPTVSYYEFGPFRLNVSERLLQRDGTVVPLTPKLIDTLVVLVENNGHVVSKDLLMKALWPDTFVEESSLTQNVSLLRKALAESGRGYHYIETLPKRGYRFSADVRQLTSETEVLTHERISTSILIEEQQLDEIKHAVTPIQDVTVARVVRSRRPALVTAACLVVLCIASLFAWSKWSRSVAEPFTPKSVAVLPFKTIGATTDSELIGLGIADAVILQIARLDRPTVLPTSSVFKFTNRDQSPLSIGRDLGVDAVLEGTVQVDGDRVRVTAQLIRTSDGKSVWSKKFDQSYQSIFALQDSVSQQLTASVISSLGYSSDTPTLNHATNNPEAYQDYLMGMYFWNRRTKENLPKAINYFERAIRKDPDFARAHALLADCHYLSSQTTFQHITQEESLARADSEASRALELDETLAEAYNARAGVAFRRLNHEEADLAFRRALELNPNYAAAHLRYGYFLFLTLKLDEALAETRQALRLDPLAPASNCFLGYLLFMARDFDGAISANKIAIELLPESTGIRYNLGQAYALKGMFPEALAEFEKLAKDAPELAAKGKIKVYGLSGRKDEAKRLLRELPNNRNQELIDLATLYASVGEKNLALEQLERALKVYGPKKLFYYGAKMKFDPQVDPLRGDQRFHELLRIIESKGATKS
jgi:DNA-binding winged helix-turn-helix (wHTH) protein/TolB-like protein/Tfp pilus assembly protein PilF